MRKTTIVSVILLCCAWFSFSYGQEERGNIRTDDGDRLSLRIILKVAPDIMIGGMLKTIGNSLSPVPDSVMPTYFGGELDVFFTRDFGLVAGYDFYGVIQATKSGYNDLDIATMSKIFIGPAFKLSLYHSETRFPGMSLSDISLKISAGINYNFFNLTDAYKALFKSIVFFTGPATGIGYFAGLGVEGILGNFIIGLGVYFVDSNFKYSAAPSSFDMMNVEIPIYFGLAF